MRNQIPNIDVDILGLATTGASILRITDLKSGSINDRITTGRNLKITGKQLKLAGDDAANGIFFINAETQARTVVDANDIIINKALQLIILVPDLPSGQYYLELISQYSRSGLLKTPVSTISPMVMTVE